jgi:hypothetical protein
MAIWTVSSKHIYAIRSVTETNQVRQSKPLTSKCLTRLPALILFSVLLTGCVTLRDPEASLEYNGDIIATIDSEHSVGQSFISHRPRLVNVQLYLRKASTQAKDTDLLTAALYHSPDDDLPLVTVPVTYSLITRSFPVTIEFPAQPDPPNQKYYILLSTKGGALVIYGRAEDANPDGSLFINGQVQSADAAMRTAYNYNARAMLGDLLASLPDLWLALPLLLLLWAPGQLLLELVAAIRFRQSKDERFLTAWDWSERQMLAIGLSLAVIPVLMLWTSTLGLHWSRAAGWVGAVMVIACLAALIFRRLRRGERLFGPDRIDFTLLSLFALALAVRLAMVRDLAAPAWVDSVHHTIIARLVVEQGAFPQSYEPLVNALHTSYHSGFHSIVATFHWLSGLELSKAMLLLCQVFNAFSVLAVYLLATSFTKDRLVGLFAALIPGFLSSMPAYYASWGRYTQLNGLLLLPVCAALVMRLLSGRAFPTSHFDRRAPDTESDNNSQPASPPFISTQMSIQLVILACLACAGLFMIHYRVIGFWALLMVAWIIGELIRSLDKQAIWKTVPLAAGWLAAVGIPAILISLPWWPGLISSLILPGLSASPTPPQPLIVDWGLLTPGFGKQIMILALAGLFISVLRARWFGPVIALWVGLLFISANQGIISLPGSSFINLTSVEIMFFLPLSVLAGYCASFITRGVGRFIPGWGRLPYAAVITLGAIITALAGAQRILPILNPVTLLFREADRPAIQWIADNISPDETILTNPFLWGYGIYAGQDGGYWISPLAGRKTMPPPILYAYGSPAEVQSVGETCKQVIDRASKPQALSELMRAQGIRFVYLGRRGGVLSPKLLVQSGLFQTRYSQAGTWLFELK